jgi:hypothetical protein
VKTRILHVSHSAAFSGAEQALLRLLSGINRDRFEPLVVLPEDGQLRVQLTRIGVRTFILPVAWWIPATHWTSSEFASQLEGLDERWRALAQLASHENVHLIHTDTIVTIEGALAAAALGIPHLWHSRGLFSPTSPNPFPPKYLGDDDFLFSIIDDLAQHVVCVSKAVYDQAASHLARTLCTVIPDGFDPEPRPVSTRGTFVAEFNWSEDRKSVV